MNPAVVILAYDRPAALKRLFDSLAAARYPESVAVPLLVSIDPGGDPEVRRVAEAFHWTHGEKRIVAHDRHLGLLAHFNWAGDRAGEYGAVILLEDDHVVSQAYYSYASMALAFYGQDDRIAGVSLYALWFNGYNHLPFEPTLDESDAFFLQVPYTIGQAFTATQWAKYRAWRDDGDSIVQAADPLHPLLLRFAPDEWFPQRIKFLVATGRFYVFPRESLSVNFGDRGAHFGKPTRWFQAPLQHDRTVWRFKSLDRSAAVYDAFFEILPERLRRLSPALGAGDFDVDLYATKPPHALTRELVLTSRRSRAPRQRFGREMRPMEANVVHCVSGGEISLSRAVDLRWGWWEDQRVKSVLRDYFGRGRGLSLPRRLLLALLEQW